MILYSIQDDTLYTLYSLYSILFILYTLYSTLYTLNPFPLSNDMKRLGPTYLEDPNLYYNLC